MLLIIFSGMIRTGICSGNSQLVTFKFNLTDLIVCKISCQVSCFSIEAFSNEEVKTQYPRVVYSSFSGANEMFQRIMAWLES